MLEYPLWLGGQRCCKCGESLPYASFLEIGLKTKGPKKNRLFVKYECESCGTIGTLIVGKKNMTLEQMCMFIVDQSNFVDKKEKIQWKRDNLPYMNRNDGPESGYELN